MLERKCDICRNNMPDNVHKGIKDGVGKIPIHVPDQRGVLKYHSFLSVEIDQKVDICISCLIDMIHEENPSWVSIKKED